MDKEVIYVADPMCSWCWGFAPVIAEVRRRIEGRAAFSLVVGGLRPGTTAAMDQGMKDTIRHHWQEVARMTGQTFNFEFFDRDGFVYDTEPACRAAVCVRAIRPDGVLSYFESLHRAFYLENRDVTDGDILADLARALGIEGGEFMAAFAAAQAKEDTAGDFRHAHSLGISGFPAVVVKDGNGYAFLTIGYRPMAALEALLEEWLEAG